MHRLVMFFALLFFVGTFFSAIYDGGGGPATTQLSSTISAAGTTASVKDTSGFGVVGTVTIDQEEINYNGKSATQLLNLSRGENGTDATSHAYGAKVYTEGTTVLNSALGFNVASVSGTVGILKLPIYFAKFVTTTIPRWVTWDYDYLKDGSFQYVRYFFMVSSIGFSIYMIYLIISAFGGIAQGLFVP